MPVLSFPFHKFVPVLRFLWVFANAAINSDFIASNRRMTDESNEETIWEEAMVA
jgi:hypothetical protein